VIQLPAMPTKPFSDLECAIYGNVSSIAQKAQRSPPTRYKIKRPFRQASICSSILLRRWQGIMHINLNVRAAVPVSNWDTIISLTFSVDVASSPGCTLVFTTARPVRCKHGESHLSSVAFG